MVPWVPAFVVASRDVRKARFTVLLDEASDLRDTGNYFMRA
jgi:hypothetical protein